MKTLILSISLFFSFGIFAQQLLEANNARITLSDDGFFFTNSGMSTPGYEVPLSSGNHTCYTMALWAGGEDLGGQLHGAFNTYPSGTDYFPGPIADDYGSTYYTSTYGTSIWEVSQADIDYHIANYTTGGYVPDPTIANWPGNGDVSEGVAAQLGPYYDMNNDQIYDPMDGDYPYIQGDRAVYVILNDAASTHTATTTNPLGMEFHIMFYQIASSDAVNNTTFMNMKIFNRSLVTYYNFRYGLFLDYDLGYYGDDFAGCDSTRNLTYVYNSLDNDPGGSGQPGYGANPPAFGTVFLNQTMGTAMAFSNGGGPTGDPTGPADYYSLMQAYWLDGTHLVNDGLAGTGSGYETNYVFSGNPYSGTGWSEVSAAIPSGDRRMIMSSDTATFLPGSSICVDVAFVFNRSGANNLENVQNLFTTTDFIQNYYDTSIEPCNDVFASVESNSLSSLKVYPNPTANDLFVVYEGQFTAEIFDLNGKLLYTEKMIDQGLINLDLAVGMYVLKISSEEGIRTEKIQIIK